MIRYFAARAHGLRPALLLLSCLAAPLLLALSVGAQPSVTTQHNDNARTGANLWERVLTVANVQRNFGKLFELAVDGDIYAQPLYVSKADVPKLGRNVVYLATMHNTVYAFDADTGAAFWQKPRSLEPSVQLDGNSDFCQNVHDVVQKEIGIIGTPVISIQNNALYVVAFTGTKKEEYSYYLHALDLLTGAEKFNGPKRIAAGGFNSYLQMQRAALLLANGIVYVAFGSYGDCNDDANQVPFHGWLFGYDAKSLTQLPTVFNTTPGETTQGGIWQAGQGPAADDAGNIYVMSGNGDFDKTSPPSSVGNSFIKLQKFLLMTDRFTPWNSKYLSDNDLDLGSGGPLLLPNTNLLVGGGKEGKLYLLNRDNLGGFCSACSEPKGDTNIVQWFQATTGPCQPWNRDNFPENGCGELSPAKNSQGYYHIHGSPVYWNGTGGPFLYVWGEADKLRRFKFENGKFVTTPITSDVITPTRSMPGAMLSLSANGNDRATGIIWASHPTGCTPPNNDNRTPEKWCDTNVGVFPGTLRAMDASTLKELWNSDLDSRDRLPAVAKFTPVTVANGKVYVATFRNPQLLGSRPSLFVYGLKALPAAAKGRR